MVQGTLLASTAGAALAFGFSWLSTQSLIPPLSVDVLGLAIVPAMVLAVVGVQLLAFGWRKPRNRGAAMIAVALMGATAFALGWILRTFTWSAGIEFPYGDAGPLAQWAIRIAEAALLTAIVLALSQSRLRNPVCGFCGAWCKRSEGVARAPVDSLSAAKHRLDNRDLVWFGDATEDPDDAYYLRFDVAQCACEKTTALSVLLQRRTRSDLYLVRELMLSPADVRTVLALAERSHARGYDKR